MPKKQNSLIQRRPVALDSKRPPRLEGDELYLWAQLVARETQIAEQKNALAGQYLGERGLTPPEFKITNDGYIVSQAELAQYARESRVQRVSASDQTEPTAPSSPPDNGS